MRTVLTMGCVVAACVWTSWASAEEHAVVQVAGPRYAEPPLDRPPPPEPPDDGYRAPMRLHIGPMAATTGRGLGPGLGVAADFGRGTIGFRLAAAWMRGEPSGADPSPIAGGLAQYTGELTLDLARRSPVHPIVGIGFGYARADTGQGAGGLGVGTARMALEYALAIDDADVRFQIGALGALPGPAESVVSDVKGWGLLGATIGIGF